jgi:hypothetical protein
MGKVAGQRVTFRASARIGAIAAALAAAAALLLPNAALASTSPTIGSAVGGFDCGGITADTIQLSSNSPSYAVPPGGTFITDWYVQVGGDTGSVSLLVWRPASTGGYTLAAVSPTVDLADPASNFTLDTPIPVQAGDVIGLRLSGALTCASYTGDFLDTLGIANSTTALGGAISIDRVGQDVQLNVAATVEMTSNPVVTTADQCKNGGWQTLTDSKENPFRNQGDCVSFVRTGGKNSGSG